MSSSGGARPTGATGPTGPGFGVPAPWSTASAYSPRDVVAYAGSTFSAVNPIPAGGSNPQVDTANWILMAQGGGEIAAAEYAGNNVALAASFATYDIPGVQIVVPAGSGPYLLRGIAGVQISNTATNGAGQVTLVIYDVDNAVNLVLANYYAQEPGAAQKGMCPMVVEKRMPATTTARTFKLQASPILSSSTAVVLGPGSNAGQQPPSLSATAR